MRHSSEDYFQSAQLPEATRGSTAHIFNTVNVFNDHNDSHEGSETVITRKKVTDFSDPQINSLFTQSPVWDYRLFLII